jgi:hypothetical protein
MSGSIIENIDFDGDLAYTGKDLDISWAYLQVKALLDSGSSDVDTYNFRQKVIDQYNLNKSAGIAEPNNNEIVDLPGAYKLGQPAGAPQIIFLKKWTADDMFADDNITNNRNDSVTTDLIEAISGEKTGTIVNGFWLGTKTNNKPHNELLGLNQTTGKLQLDDKGAVSNITSWVLHWKAKTRWLPTRKLFSKGATDPVFTITALSQKKDKIKMDGSKVDKLAIQTSANVFNFFQVPFETSWSNYSNKIVDFYLVRDGQTMGFYMDNHDGQGPKECPQEIPGSLPTLINMNEQSSPMEFLGEAYETMSDIWIADSNTTASSLATIGNPETRFQFGHDLNLTTSYFDFKNFFADKFGNFAQIYGIDKASNLLQGTQGNQTHWTTSNSQDGLAHGFVPRERVLQLTKAYQTLGVENFNFASNFTISCYVRTGSAGTLIRCQSGSNTFELKRRWDKESWDVLYNGVLKSRVFVTGLTEAALTNDWHHLTVVKNRNVIGIWTNGQYNGYAALSDTEVSNIPYNQLSFVGNNEVVYLADVRVLGYAMSNIPARDFGKRDTYSFIDTLKQSLDI